MPTKLSRPYTPLTSELRKIYTSPRLLQAFEDLFRAVPGDYNTLVDEINDLEDRIEELEVQFVSVAFGDSPYTAVSGDWLTVDTALGDVEIILPTEGFVSISKLVDANTINITGTVNGETDFTIELSPSTASLRYNGTEWRYE